MSCIVGFFTAACSDLHSTASLDPSEDLQSSHRNEASVNNLTTISAAPLFNGKRVVGYWPNYSTNYSAIQYDKLSYLTYSCLMAKENGSLDLSQCDTNRLAIIRKAAAPYGVRVLVSLYGSTDSGLGVAIRNATSRTVLVDKCAAFVLQQGLSGFDIDWEGPRSGDLQAYQDFVARMYSRLSPNRVVSLAVANFFKSGLPTGSSFYQNSVNFVNLMSYGALGTPATLSYAKNYVETWVAKGVPRDKVVMGVPFYGYSWAGTTPRYAAICAADPQAPYHDWTDALGGCDYNGLDTVWEKASWVRGGNAGGVMAWALGYDMPGSRSLLAAMHGALMEPSTALVK